MFSFSGPAEVRGFYQRLRDSLQPFLILIFMLSPWIKINGEPMILIDVFNRHFVLFGVTFYSHDAPLLFFILILLILAIFIVTALFGRLWCGWACPQTVFIHTLFNKIEKMILGAYTERYQIYKNPDTLTKKIKVFSVYLVFLILCWGLAHSLGAYFLGAQVVTRYIVDGPVAHIKAFSFLSALTSILFFNFTFFREKFCFNICPYGRFQSSLLDRNSLIVFYDTDRGEPRGALKPAQKELTPKGDCVDCNRCVRVCPTKIDIRNGLQLECIACGKCIDACNDVMAKTNRPLNLISYETGNRKKIKWMRFRLVLYAGLFILFLIMLLVMLSGRNSVDFNVARSHSAPFAVRLESEQRIFQNSVVLHIKNQTHLEQVIQVSLSEANNQNGYRLSTPALQLQLQAGQDLSVPAFIEISENQFKTENNDIQIQLKTPKSEIQRQIKFLRVQ